MLRKSFLAVLICSSLVKPVLSRGLDVTGMPEEFRRYFFDSPVPVRVLLNDEPAFDGTFILNESGLIRLKTVLSTADDTGLSTEQISQWEKHLQNGLMLGECTEKCPDGFVAAEYVLERSELKIYTRQYEQNRVASNYIQLPDTLPSGLIVKNDMTASGSSTRFDDWRLSSSWLASLFGWTQKLMLQSAYSHSSQGYRNSEISEAWTQKEFEGQFFRTGVFSPDTESGNVQMPGYSSSRIAGAMWGTSDTLLSAGESVSLYPVYVTGRNQSVADVFINERLVYTQQLRPGIQALDTRRLPGGVYDITIRISENGKVTDVQRAQVYKPARWGNADKRWRASIWAGQSQQDSIYSGEQNGEAWGFRADFLLHPRSTAGISLARNAGEQVWSLKNETQVTDKTTLYSRYNLWQDGRRDSDVRLFRTLGAGSINAGWRHGVTARDTRSQGSSLRRTSNLYTASLTWQFQNQLSLTAGGQYTRNGYRNGLSSDVSVRKTVNVWNRSTELRLSAYQRPSWTSGKKDTGIEIGISIPLFSDIRTHSASAEIGTKNNESYANVNYNWRPDEPGTFSYLGATSSFSRNSRTAGLNGGIQGRYATGDFYAQTTSGIGGIWSGVNLSNTFAVGGGKIAAASDLRDASAAVIVDVESARKDPGLTVVSPAGEIALRQGRNLVSADVWQRRTMQFDGNARESLNVYPPAYSYQMNRGSVGYVSVKAVRKMTVIALLTSVDGSPVMNREAVSDIDQAHVNSDGVVTIDVSTGSRYIAVTNTDDQSIQSCPLPEITDGIQDTVFIDRLQCK
ncbi:TcfC E-set like domain-containing protein [Enterobacter bugandensis]|uniref:TcfC E-set like domain-containing protein n=1 Tax=Enterobacter bugandensis TaxID=881260 RepID=UPI0021D3D800|nr:TcfC E-set like domain-containing protein [Enterobacter bugandensis]MCU6172417.1 TcfC E-set like domain-containing protein [Enterobacter bugandensis]